MKNNTPPPPSRLRKLDDSRSFSKSLEQLGTGGSGRRSIKYVIRYNNIDEERNQGTADKLSEDFTLSDFRSCVNIPSATYDKHFEASNEFRCWSVVVFNVSYYKIITGTLMLLEDAILYCLTSHARCVCVCVCAWP